MQRRVVMEPQIPPMTEGVLRLLLLLVSAFILQWAAVLGFQRPLYGLALTFGPDFYPTQILTHIFLTERLGLGSIITLLFHSLFLWSFGAEIERLWGRVHFLRLFASGIAGSMVTASIAGLTYIPGITLAGMLGGLSGILLAFALLWPDRQVYFFMIPMKMRWLILIFLLLMAVSSLESILQVTGGALGGAAFVYYYVRRGNRSYASYEEPSSGGGIKAWWEEFTKKRRLEKKRKEISRRIDLKEEVDRILEKISKTGMQSLTRKEKSLLDQASREL